MYLLWLLSQPSRDQVYRDMEEVVRTCEYCGKYSVHTFRYITISGYHIKKIITLICNNCHEERQLGKRLAARLVHDYDLRIRAWEADMLLRKNKIKKAEKKIKNALKDGPGHFFCLAMLAKCRMAAGDRDGATKIIMEIKRLHPDKDVQEVWEEVLGRVDSEDGTSGSKTSANESSRGSHKRDHYKVLGVSRMASQKEIKQKYRAMILRFHPDRNDSPDAAKILIRITEAYKVLSDPVSRRAFDRSN